MPGVRDGVPVGRALRAHRGAGARGDREELPASVADACRAAALLSEGAAQFQFPGALGAAAAAVSALAPAIAVARERRAQGARIGERGSAGAADRTGVFLRRTGAGVSGG